MCLMKNRVLKYKIRIFLTQPVLTFCSMYNVTLRQMKGSADSLTKLCCTLTDSLPEMFRHSVFGAKVQCLWCTINKTICFYVIVFYDIILYSFP